MGLLTGGLLLLVILRIAGGQVDHLVWVDRDLWRSTLALERFPVYGAELNYGPGARVPGGAYHALLAIPLGLGGGALAAYRFLLALDGAAALVLAVSVGRWRGALAGVLTAAVYLGACEAREAFAWLWNPTALPLFVAASVPLLHAALRSGRSWPHAGWVLALALGAQVHLTAGVWLVSAGLGLLLVRPRAALTALPAALTVLALAWLPYLVVEGLTGWPNTRAFAEQGPVRSATHGRFLTLDSDELVQSARFLLPQLGGASAAEALLAALVAAAAITAAVLAWRPEPTDPARDTLRVLSVATCLTVAVPALSPSVDVEWRYVVAALPGFAVLAGVGLASLGAASRRWLGAALPGAAVAVGIAAAAPLVELPTLAARGDHHSLDTWDGLIGATEGLRERHGWSLADVVGRTALLRREGDRLRWREASPLDSLLLRDGVAFPGSQPPPCIVGVTNLSSDQPVDAAALAAVLGRSPGDVRVLERTAHAPTEALIRYELASGRCPTTLVDRYLDTPAEAALRPLWDALEQGDVVEVPGPDGPLRAALLEASRGPNTSRILVGVELTPSPGRLGATLHAHQLRGHAYNTGWYQDGLVDGLTLVLTGDHASLPITLADGPVGLSGVVTPLSADAPVPPGTWEVSLRTRVVPVSRDHPDWPLPLDGVAVEVPLGRVVVPEP